MRKNKLISFSVIYLVFSLSPLHCFAQADHNVRGPAFSSPGTHLSMTKEWQQQALRYEEWAQGADLALSLDQQLYMALTPLINRFAAEKKLTIRVHEGTCGISAGQLFQKSADITGFCCPPGETDRLPGLAYHTLGISSLHIIVNAANPIDNLSVEQVRKIFRGEITSWRSFPGIPNAPGSPDIIDPIARLHCKNRPGHWRLILDNEDLFSARMQDVGTIRDMISKIAADKNSIGYEVLWHIKQIAPNGAVKSIHINNNDPNRPENLLSLTYPFYRTFSITSWEPDPLRKEIADQLIAYIMAHIGEINPDHALIPATALRKAGWKFTKDELTGEPE